MTIGFVSEVSNLVLVAHVSTAIHGLILDITSHYFPCFLLIVLMLLCNRGHDLQCKPTMEVDEPQTSPAFIISFPIN